MEKDHVSPAPCQKKRKIPKMTPQIDTKQASLSEVLSSGCGVYTSLKTCSRGLSVPDTTLKSVMCF